MRRLVRCLIAAILVIGCSAPAASTLPTSQSPTVTTPAQTSSTPVVSIPPASVAPSIAASGLGPDTVAEVVTDDLRVRTAPTADDTSVVLEPLLQPGEKLFVVDGPVEADGYPWYQILIFDEQLTMPGEALDEKVIEHGWVAGADTNGEVWLEAARPSCPAAPEDVADLASIEGETALACFGDEPITINARVLDCGESPELDPQGVCGGETGGFYVRAVMVRSDLPIPRPGRWPVRGGDARTACRSAGTYPDPVPLGEPVRVTGQFNPPGRERLHVDVLCRRRRSADRGLPDRLCGNRDRTDRTLRPAGGLLPSADLRRPRVRGLECRDVQLRHLEHGLHRALRTGRIGSSEHLVELLRDDLP